MSLVAILPAVTLQEVFIDISGTKSTAFTVFESIENSEKKLVVKKNNDVEVSIYKDSMFTLDISAQERANSYVLDTFSRIGNNGLCVSFNRFVLGDATSVYDQAAFFSDINEDLQHYHDEDLVDGCYLNNTGRLCKKDESGNELWIDYEFQSTTSTHTGGFTHKYPERTNNYPIPERLAISPRATLKINPPKMSVNDWLNTPMDELLSDEEKMLAIHRGLKREIKSKKKGLLLQEKRDKLSLDKRRLVQWEEDKAQRAMEDAIYGTQLELI